jgi:hypothetical protein
LLDVDCEGEEETLIDDKRNDGPIDDDNADDDAVGN